MAAVQHMGGGFGAQPVAGHAVVETLLHLGAELL
jgi:hypothetical protein